MPRARRIYLDNAIYYVALEGPSRELIFRDHSDYLKYMELLTKCKAEYGFKLFAYTLLGNSIYLLIDPNETFPLSQIMQKITPTYTKYYNAKYNRSGHLFQKRYRSVHVEKSVYLPRLTRYIHLLPEQLQKDTSFKEYVYSSYPQFEIASASTGTLPRNDVPEETAKDAVIASEAKQSLRLDIRGEANEVLNHLDRPGISYEEFMLSQTAEEREFLEKKLARGTVLGTDEFEAEVKEKIKALSRKRGMEGAMAGSVYVIRKTTLALSSVLMITVMLSGYSVYLSFTASSRVIPEIFSRESKVVDPRLKHSGMTAVPETVEAVKPIPVLPKEEKADLEGTIWDVELITFSKDGSEKQIADKLRFTGNGFESYYFLSQGFKPSNYTVTVKEGVITWETMQTNERGETVSWHGDWNGKRMEGMMSYRPEGKTPQDFSFMSSSFGVQK